MTRELVGISKVIYSDVKLNCAYQIMYLYLYIYIYIYIYACKYMHVVGWLSIPIIFIEHTQRAL